MTYAGNEAVNICLQDLSGWSFGCAGPFTRQYSQMMYAGADGCSAHAHACPCHLHIFLNCSQIQGPGKACHAAEIRGEQEPLINYVFT